MDIGEQIKRAREKRGLTQKELADLVDVAPITIHQYEHGKRYPRFDILAKISEILCTTFIMSRDIYRNIDGSIEYAAEVVGDEKTKEYLQQRYGLEISPSDPISFDIIHMTNILNEEGKNKVAEYAEDLTKIPEYRNDPPED